jgi:hypothetical protein
MLAARAASGPPDPEQYRPMCFASNILLPPEAPAAQNSKGPRKNRFC